MPEGDTIWRTARALDAALAGATVLSFASSVALVEARARDLGVAGREVTGVESRGKHLLVHLSGDLALHTHQGMHGGWSLRRPRPSPQSQERLPRARIETARAVALCHGSPVVELLTRRELRAHPALGRLGPDLLSPGFDGVQARQRLRAGGEVPVAVALLAQSALAGIGNVYKSEALFACGLSPQTPVSRLADAELDALIETARLLLQRNLGPGPRRTTTATAAEPLSVYGRSGKPCLRCGGVVRRIAQGDAARSTYFCPRCQPAR